MYICGYMRLDGCAALAKQLNNQKTKQPKDSYAILFRLSWLSAIRIAPTSLRNRSKTSQRSSTENVPTS